MNTSPLVSIVVPIYGVERYLRQCVDSILAQTLQEIEVILVDDGSPDACPAIVDEYAARDARVVAVHQPNGGYGKAVNHGISLARAPYIGIIESDDWIEPSMYEELFNRAQETKADIVKCMFWKYDSSLPVGKQDELWLTHTHNLYDAPDIPFAPIEWEPIFFYHASLWSNLYAAKLIKEIRIPETAGAAYQDFPFIMEAYARAARMSIVKKPLLHYRMEANQGNSSTSTHKGLMRMADMTSDARDILVQFDLLDKVKEAFYFHAYMANIGYLTAIQPEYRQIYFDKLNKLMAPLLDDSSFTWKYFPKKHKKKALYIARGGPAEALLPRWGIHFKRGCLCIHLFGIKHTVKLWH